MLGQFRRGGGDPAGEAGDGLAGDREVPEVCLGLAQPGPQALDLPAQVVGLRPGGFLADVQCLKERLDMHAATAASRQVGTFTPVRRRTIT
ncbi:hypothetical protein AB0B95_33575 [Streptomyces hygroscopicus]|uniref:hypothetical protein n=1 Tax=Streptomyces hygroscopicus TaxID=1912 RepID=UPI000767C7A7|nr:hypothetical protein [Streptomyces hygroscopicus]